MDLFVFSIQIAQISFEGFIAFGPFKLSGNSNKYFWRGVKFDLLWLELILVDTKAVLLKRIEEFHAMEEHPTVGPFLNHNREKSCRVISLSAHGGLHCI